MSVFVRRPATRWGRLIGRNRLLSYVRSQQEYYEYMARTSVNNQDHLEGAARAMAQLASELNLGKSAEADYYVGPKDR